MEYKNESSELMHYIMYFDETQVKKRIKEIPFFVVSKLNSKLASKSERIELERIEPLVKILISDDVMTTEKVVVDPEQDLNLLSDSELNQIKARMDKNFVKNKIKPGDKSFVYDKQVDFESGDEAASWDESEGEDD